MIEVVKFHLRNKICLVSANKLSKRRIQYSPKIPCIERSKIIWLSLYFRNAKYVPPTLTNKNVVHSSRNLCIIPLAKMRY